MKILFSGGGTGGPVTPLLAVAEVLRSTESDEAEFFWLGTRTGPEQQLIEGSGIKFKAIASGKLRRYWSWQNFSDLFRFVRGLFQAWQIVGQFQPDIILSAGGYVSVPVVLAGWARGVPAIVHQQDLPLTLAVRLMTPFVKLITVSFEDTLKFFSPKQLPKTKWIGHPVRAFLKTASKNSAMEFFELDPQLPTVLVTGGATGSSAINGAIAANLSDLLKVCQVIHQTGRGKSVQVSLPPELAGRYRQYEFLTSEIAMALAAADLVVSRAGASIIFELAYLDKASLLVPLPDTPQEPNARALSERGAAVVLTQTEIHRLPAKIKELLQAPQLCLSLATNIASINKPDATQNFVQEIKRIISQ